MMSFEDDIRQYQMWLEGQDFIHDAPEYYVNALFVEAVRAGLNEFGWDNVKLGEYVRKQFREHKDG
jgi:hypothetical protein